VRTPWRRGEGERVTPIPNRRQALAPETERTEEVRDFCRREVIHKGKDRLLEGEQHDDEFYAALAHAGYIGMSVRDDWHGKGVGTALMRAIVDLADNWIGYRRLELTVYTDNAAALALYRKFGFDVEGTLRDYSYRDGRYVDAYTMARLRTAGDTREIGRKLTKTQRKRP